MTRPATCNFCVCSNFSSKRRVSKHPPTRTEADARAYSSNRTHPLPLPHLLSRSPMDHDHFCHSGLHKQSWDRTDMKGLGASAALQASLAGVAPPVHVDVQLVRRLLSKPPPDMGKFHTVK